MPLLNIGTNVKLGKKIASYSRPVGPTCPSDCPFLTGKLPTGEEIPKGQRCYAESIEKRYKNVRDNWAKNRNAVWPQWQGAFLAETRKAAKKVVAIRIHVGGDWVEKDEVDRPYLAAMLGVLRQARREGITIPFWYYTHAWRKMGRHKKYLKKLGVHGFASVHCEADAKEAAANGWRLAIDPGKAEKQRGFKEIYTVRSLGCPEQTTDGAVDCSKCGYCFKDGPGKGNVTFFRH